MANKHLPATSQSDKIPLVQKISYGLGSFTNNLLSGAIGSMAIVLNLGLKMNPAAIGTIMAGSHLTDALLDPVMGYISDHTQSPWGRRRPYIVVGALLSALLFSLMWQIPSGHSQTFYFWFFILGMSLFYAAFSVYATPFVALGYEMTADYYERIRIQGFSNLIGQVPWLLLPWSYAFMENKSLFASNVDGAKALAMLVGIVVACCGVLPGLFCREPFYEIAQATRKTRRAATLARGLSSHIAEFIRGFSITMRNRRFLQLAAATFLVFNGFTLISGLSPYVIIFYVFGGDKVNGAHYVGWFGTALSACTFGAIGLVAWLATKIGKKRAFIVSTSIAIFGYALKGFCYRPGAPHWLFLPAPFIAFGLGGLFTTVSSMIADVCDLDELEVGVRREGTFGAIYWWMVKLGTAVALAISGNLINATGFQQALGSNQSAHTVWMMRVFEIGFSILAYVLALAAIATYDLSSQRVQSIRLQLEERRGKTSTTGAVRPAST